MRIVFMGTPTFAGDILTHLINQGVDIPLVISQPDRKSGRGKKILGTPVKNIAIENNIQVLQPERLNNDREVISKLKEINADFFVVVAYGQILSREILDIPKYASVNLHGSLLPKYRGSAPVQRAIMNGETETGLTVIAMDEDMDTGGMISRLDMHIPPYMDSGDLFKEMANEGGPFLYVTLSDIEKNGLEVLEQNEREATYAPPILKEEARINFNDGCESIVNKIRGLSPFLGAFMENDGRRIKIWKAESILGKHVHPNGFIKYEDDGILIAASDGYVKVLELQVPGKKRMKTSDFLRGRGKL